MNNVDINEFYNWFLISVGSLNIFSFVLGGMWGLSTSCFKRYRNWWIIAIYFIGVAIYFAVKAGDL